jgi:hypothetical protein
MQTAHIVYRNQPNDEAYFEIFGADVEPAHWAWPVASPADRATYWTRLAVLAGTAWDAQIAAGIGADGAPLMAVRRRGNIPKPGTSASRKWDAKLTGRFDRDIKRQDGPPLTPHRLASRARRWARAKPMPDRVRFYWVGSHKGKKWSAIMAWHSLGMAGTGKKGQVTGKVRDIVGIADKFLAPAVARARKDWAASVGAKYEGMARAMGKRLILLREEIQELEEMATAVLNIERFASIRNRINVVRSMANRIAADPVFMAFVNTQRPVAPRPQTQQPQRRTLFRRTLNQPTYRRSFNQP